MILVNYYKNFAKIADSIPQWREMSKNDLLNAYIDHEEDCNKRESYIAAIMCRYWGAIGKYYRTSSYSASVEDCFEWLTHAVMYALKQRKWRDPENKLFTDVNGPDKVLNRCIISTRHIFYQASNTDSRKLNFAVESIEGLFEDNLSYVLPADDNASDDMTANLYLKDLVRDSFNREYYIQAFIIDGIINAPVFDIDKGTMTSVFSKRKLVKHLRTIDFKYCDTFASTYTLPLDKVQEISEFLKEISSTKLYKIIDQTLEALKKKFDPNN